MPSPYTQQGPTTQGTRITVDAFLNNSPMVQRTLEELSYERFISDYILREGERTTSGAVLYQQLLENDLFTERDVQEIEELSEFPILNTGERGMDVATVKKWGGAVLFSDEKRRRDQRDLLARDLRRLSNTTVRKVNRVTVAVINADTSIRSHGAAAVWSDATNRDVIGDLANAKSLVDDIDMGYEADTVLINPTNALEAQLDKTVRDSLPRENEDINPLLDGDLSGLLDLDFVKTNDVPEGTAYVLSRLMVGSYHDELPFYSRVVPWPQREGTLLMAARVTVPVITDPLAIVKITGI